MSCVSGPNQALHHCFDHLGDKRSSVREAILNVVTAALLAFPSYEFDLRGLVIFLTFRAKRKWH